MRVRIQILLPCMLLLASASPARGGFVSEIRTGSAWSDNLNLASKGSEARADAAFGFAGIAGERFQIGTNGGLTLSGSLESRTFRDLDGLDTLAPGASVAYRRKVRLGARVPWVQVSASAVHEGVRDDARRGWLYEGAFRYGWFAGSSSGFTVEGAYSARDAASTVFDQNAGRVSFRYDAAMCEWLAIYAVYAARRGDVTSSTLPDPAFLAASKSVVDDPVFGSGFRAYRLDATSHDLRIGLNGALGRHASLELVLDRLLARASGGIDYTAGSVAVTFLYRF